MGQNSIFAIVFEMVWSVLSFLVQSAAARTSEESDFGCANIFGLYPEETRLVPPKRTGKGCKE